MLKADSALGGYKLIRSLGKGGMAEVFLALKPHPQSSTPEIALKVIHPHLSQDREFVQMLIDEAQLSAQLNHPNIVNVHRLGFEDGLYFIEMDFIDGCDVYQALVSCEGRRAKIDFEVAAWVIHEACSGLHYAHTKCDQYGNPLNVIHRDISPQNLQLSYNGEVKVVDFGIAKAEERNSHTQQGVIKGKYSYMSPEQAWGDQIDHRSDIFSLGICLYEMIAGEVLYDAADGLGLLEQVRLAQIPNLRAIRSDIPADLEQIVYKALMAEPVDRFVDAEHMRNALASYLNRVGVRDGRSHLISFMKSLGLSSSIAPKGPMAMGGDEERTKAVSVGMFEGLSSASMIEGSHDFADQEKTKAVSADLFSGLSTSGFDFHAMATPAPLPSSSQMASGAQWNAQSPSLKATDDFNEADKTKAVSADMFTSLTGSLGGQVSSSIQSEDKTRAVQLSELSALSSPSSFATPSPPPPPPPSMLAPTESSVPMIGSFESQERTKAMSVDVAAQLLSSSKGSATSPSPVASSQRLKASGSFPSPAVSGSFPSPAASGSFPSPAASGSFPSPTPESHLADKQTNTDLDSSLDSSYERSARELDSSEPNVEVKGANDQAERGRRRGGKKSTTSEENLSTETKSRSSKKAQAPMGRARGRGQSKLAMILGIVVFLLAIGSVIVPKLLRQPLPQSYSLSVSANAQGAKVYRDGQDTGQFTPALLQGLKPNVEYMIKVEATGYEAKTRSVKYSGEQLLKKKEPLVRFLMKRAKGTLRVKSSPSGVSVYLKGSYLGKTPIYKRNMDREVGGVELKFRKDGCDPKDLILQWGEDLESVVDVSLKCR